MKTIIIPDIHHHINWIENFICDQEFDEIVFLGDYLDDFGDSPKDAIKTAKWLKHSLTCERRVHLAGNHDTPVMFPKIHAFRCSGWTQEKCDAANSILTKEDWNKLKLCYNTQGYLLSHAGAHPHIFGHPINGMTIEGVEGQCKKALESARKGFPTHYLGAGRSRGGSQIFGGITWLDWSEFKPVAGISQVVGHSRGREVRTNHIEGSENYCIDCDNKYIGIIQDGVFSYIKNDYL